ncbi:hypothetical protein VSH64_21190 [Amycolatopsis rhabdoformis]|uniref:Uncharacterized protein n=1 Tax=Amycolatopsis rhabdoformis TaxID=1448059 RepID=A0ABZ1ILJ4_9PSEU|nr:hypothetical protein [Amycolatopsis rhabdoformis]WSE34568.1 hypothetical protein VSH64_21190 [Amycolatopsis rhabdoformis]
MAIAARGCDIAKFRASASRLEHEVPVDEKATRYVTYLLWRQVKDTLGRQPADSDFEIVAHRAHERVSQLLKVTPGDLEGVVRVVFGRSFEGFTVSAGDFILMGSAILGSLMENPVSDLGKIYPKLEEWYRNEYCR